MLPSLTLSLLLGAGVIAHPHFKLNNPLAHHHHKREVEIVDVEYLKNAQGQVTEVVDVVEAMTTVFVGGGAPAPSPAPAPAAQPIQAGAVNVKADYHAPTQEHQPAKEAEKPAPAKAAAPAAAPAPAPAPSPAPAPAPAPAPVKAAPSSTDSSEIIGGQNVTDVANSWRVKQGLPIFTWDPSLVSVSANTNTANGANSMTHHNVAPSLGQVIAQGSSTLKGPSSQGELGPIDLLWLGWLCELSGEIPSFPCADATAATHMNTEGQTDHATILMNKDYSRLGCNFMDATDPGSQVFPDIYQGMFVCDVA